MLDPNILENKVMEAKRKKSEPVAPLSPTDYSLYVPSCQKQADKSSCGVFALAFAVEVALGADPSTIVFVKEAQMKDHLKGCLWDLN